MHTKLISIGILFLIVLIAGCTQQISRNDNLPNLRKISGSVIQNSDYCGGAAPPPGLIDELQKEITFPNKKLYIREGNINSFSKPIIREFISEENGTFNISLPSGRYCIIEDIKKDELKIPNLTEINKGLPNYSQYSIQNEQCFKDWWGTCDKILLVENQDINDFIIKYHHSCGQPCVTGGPMPQ